MNRNALIRRIQDLTSNWDINTWRYFRSINNYWVVRDKSRADDGYFNEVKYVRFLTWKLEEIIDYLN